MLMRNPRVRMISILYNKETCIHTSTKEISNLLGLKRGRHLINEMGKRLEKSTWKKKGQWVQKFKLIEKKIKLFQKK